MTKLLSFYFSSKFRDSILVNRPENKCHNCDEEKDADCEICCGQSFYQSNIP
jgi:hypothetical protein